MNTLPSVTSVNLGLVEFVRPRREYAIVEVSAQAQYYGRDTNGTIWMNNPKAVAMSFESEFEVYVKFSDDFGWTRIESPERFGDWRVYGPAEYMRRFFLYGRN